MKKVITVISVCLVACLLIVGFIPASETVYAATGDFQSDSVLVALKPEVVNVSGKNYYLINNKVNGGEETGAEFRKWKWVLNNANGNLNYDNNVVLIETDLDFSAYTNLKPVSAKIARDEGIKFSIQGGKYNKGENKIDTFIPTITNYYNDNTAQTKNSSFITKLNGGMIANLNFVGFNVASTSREVKYAGLIGEMQCGTISKVSVNSSSISTTYGDAGGLVGKFFEGNIENCDFQGEVKAENGVAGGIAGTIPMQEFKEQQDASIKNSYAILSNITAKEIAGSIIGSITYTRGVKYDNNVKIIVKDVFAKVEKFTIINASKDTVTGEINNAPQGIVGYVADRQGFEDASETVKPAPGQTVVPKDALPLDQILVFDNVITSKDYKLFNKIENKEVEIVLDATYTAPVTPKNVPLSVLSYCKTIKNAEYSLAINFNLFPVETWIMDDVAGHYELKYKKSGLKTIKVSIVETGVKNYIVEADANGNVSYIDGKDVVFTINAEDGVYVREIIGKKANAQVGEALYTATTKFPEPTEDLFAEGKNGLGICTAGCSFDYSKSQLKIPSTAIANYDEIVFNFNDLTGKKHTVNEYKATFSVKDIDGNIIPTDLYYYNSNVFTKIETALQGSHIIGEGGKNQGMQIYIPKESFNAYILDGIKIIAQDGEEYLTEGIDKGYEHLPDKLIDGKNYACYTIRVNHLGIKLYNREQFKIEFVLKGQDAKITYFKDQDLVYNKYITVDYLFADTVTKNPIYGRKYTVKIAFDKINNGKDYVFNLVGEGCITINKEPLKVEDISTMVETNADGSKTSYVMFDYTFTEQAKIDINIARRKKVTISNEKKDLFNPPTIKIGNIPVIVEDFVKEYDGTPTEVDFSKVSNFTFDTIDGVNPTIELVVNKNYLGLGTIKVGTKPSSFENIEYTSSTNEYIKKGEVKLSGENSIKLNYLIKEYAFSIKPVYIYSDGTKEHTFQKGKEFNNAIGNFEYGKNIFLTNSDIPSNLREMFEFVAWADWNADENTKVDAIGLDKLGTGVREKNVRIEDNTIVCLVLRPKYTVKFNATNGKNVGCNGMGRIVKDNFNYADGTEFVFGSELNNSVIKYTISTNENKYKINSIKFGDKIINFNEPNTDVPFISLTGNEHKAILEIDVNKLRQSIYATSDGIDLDISKLALKIDVDFALIKHDMTITANTINGDPATYNVTLYKPEASVLASDKLATADGVVFSKATDTGIIYGTNCKLEIKANTNDDSYEIEVKVLKGNIEILHTTRNTINGRYEVYEFELVDNVELQIQYKKVDKTTIHTIDSVINVEGIDKNNIDLSTIDIESNSALITNIKNGFLHGSKISLTINRLDEKYEFVSWDFYKCNKATFDNEATRPAKAFSKDTINCELLETEFVSDYVVVLNVKEKTYDVAITVPQIPSGNETKPVDLVVFIDGAGFKFVYGASPTLEALDSNNKDAKGITLKVDGNVVTLQNVKHNTHIYFKLANEDNYIVDYWNNGKYPYLYASNNDLGLIRDNITIDLKIKPKKIIDASTNEDKIKFTHSMAYDGVSSIGNTKFVGFDADDNAIIEAIPSKGNVFVKWLKNGEELAENGTSPRIVVKNETAKYEAVFAKKEYNINFINKDFASVTGVSKAKAGDTITLSLNIKPGYTVDKVIVNGKEQLLGNVKSFTIRDVNEDQSIEIIYRKVGKNAKESQIEDSAKKLVISTVIILIIAVFVNRKINKKFRGKINRTINVD